MFGSTRAIHEMDHGGVAAEAIAAMDPTQVAATARRVLALDNATVDAMGLCLQPAWRMRGIGRRADSYEAHAEVGRGGATDGPPLRNEPARCRA